MANYLIITGASRGIGFSTAEKFLANGWQVINLSRKPCKLDGVANFAIDFSQDDWESVVRNDLLAKISKAKQICLVHNAAKLEKDTVFNLEKNTFRKNLEINVIAPAILNSLLIPHMDPRSSIIYVGSTLSEKAVKNTASYVISKHALLGMMRATCQDLAGSGIHTACVCPGFTDTEMLRDHIGHDESVLQSVAGSNAANRLVSPGEIADSIYFCAMNPVINGTVMHANLGERES